MIGPFAFALCGLPVQCNVMPKLWLCRDFLEAEMKMKLLLVSVGLVLSVCRLDAASFDPKWHAYIVEVKVVDVALSECHCTYILECVT